MPKNIAGKYFGTEINEKWWRRYTKDKMLARGNGALSFNEQSISFLRQLTEDPIHIKTQEIVGLKIGKWHAGQWGAGRQIIKVIWKKDRVILSSGFSISKKPNEIKEIISELNKIIEAVKK